LAELYPVRFNIISSGDPACVGRTHITIGGIPLARPNFKYEKRRKELAKQKKAEEKRLRKLEKRNETAGKEPPEPVPGGALRE